MKKLLLTIGLVASVSMAYGQGTVAFSNSSLQRLSSGEYGSVQSTWTTVTTTAGAIRYGLFYGATAGSLTYLDTVIGVNSSTGLGLIASSADSKTALSLVAIPGFAATTTPFIQIKGWTASFGADWAAAQAASLVGNSGVYFGQTAAIQIAGLGPGTGPGTAIWQGNTGTIATRFKPLNLVLMTTVPEPSSMALLGLGTAAMLIFRRRK